MLTKKCKWFSKRFGGYNDCINCEAENECREATGDVGV
jgi:hypothetical protein